MLDRQKFVDDGYRYFVTEGHPPSMENDTCRYRTEEGNRCVIGLQIPDEKYDPSMEGYGPVADVIRDAIGGADTAEDGSFLEELQGCHDQSALSITEKTFHQLFERELHSLCTKFDLVFPGAAGGTL